MSNEQVYCHRDYTKANVYKIGKTTQSWQQRLYQLNHNTGALDDNTLEPVFVKHVANCTNAEIFLHTNLQQYRINNRKEFFEVDIWTVKYWFDQIPGTYIVNNVPTTAIAVPVSVPTLSEPLIVRETVIPPSRKKALSICCVICSVIILVAIIIYIARMNEDY